MANSIVRLPLGYFPDPNKGRPLFNASIYIGEPDLDPRIPTNQKTVTGRQENGTETPLSQPIATSAGGVPVDSSGNYVTLLVDGAYSMAVDDRQDNQVYYFANVLEGAPLTIEDMPDVFKEFSPDYSYIPFNNVADAKSGTLKNGETINLAVGDYVKTAGYTTAGDGGGADYVVVAGGTGTDDGGSYHDMANGNQLELVDNGKVRVSQFGALGDGVSDDSQKVQSFINYCQAVRVKGIINKPCNLNDTKLTITGDVDIECTDNGSLLNGSVYASGTIGSETAITSDVSEGDTVIGMDGTGLQAGDKIFIRSAINCVSVDAGTNQLGAFPTRSYFAEFLTVVSATSSQVVVEEAVLWPYTVAAGPNSGSRATSTVQKVNFIENLRLKLSQKEKASSELALLQLEYCRNAKVSGDYELSGTGYMITMYRCLDCVASDVHSNRPAYNVQSSTYNSFLTLGSTRCGIKDSHIRGGYQAIDFTFFTSEELANPSMFCYATNIQASDCYDGATSHGGTFSSHMEEIRVYNAFNGIRVRSKQDKVINSSINKTKDRGGFGVLVTEGFNDGTFVSGVVIQDALYGVQIQIDDPQGNYSEAANVKVTDITALDCSSGVYVDSPSATNRLSNLTIEGVTVIRPESRGIYINQYNNGVTVKNVHIIDQPSNARAGIEYSLNIINLTIDGVIFSSCESWGLRGASTGSFITDLTTFPGGDAEAKLSINNVNFVDHTGGEYTGIKSDAVIWDTNRKDFTHGVTIGPIIARQQHATVLSDLLSVENSASTKVFSVSTLGKLDGTTPNSVRDDIAAAADLTALKAALAGLFT